VIAEDLGLITQQVEELRDALGFPGMRVLQFAFDGDPKNPHLPANYPANSVAYTGTHDNDTVSGWWEAASEAERVRVGALIPGAGAEIHWALIRLVADSGANLAIVPAQDLLGLGSGARMNTPGTSAGNWSWRLRSMELLDPEVLRRLRGLTGGSGRLSSVPVLHDSL
jgi:4-alpha-glucanotransferase